MLSKIYVFTSQVKHNNKTVLPIPYWLFICSQNNRRSHQAEEAGVELASKVDRIKYTGKAGWEMPHQFWLIKTLPRLSQTKKNTTRWLPELCTAKPHDTRNGEDTRGTLQVLFLCTIKLAVLIADISNIYRHLQYCICFWIFFSGFGCKSPADTLQGSYLDSKKVYY